MGVTNIHRILIERYEDENGYYELYSDGYIIQGGLISSVANSTAEKSYNFIKEFNIGCEHIELITDLTGASNTYGVDSTCTLSKATNESLTTFYYRVYEPNGSTVNVQWKAQGY